MCGMFSWSAALRSYLSFILWDVSLVLYLSFSKYSACISILITRYLCACVKARAT